MKRGDLFLVQRGAKNDPKKQRVYVVVSRQTFINTRFSTVICAPVYTIYGGLKSQVQIGVEEGLKHESTIYCDELHSLEKSQLTNYIGNISPAKMQKVNEALRIALAIN